jgi:hypothetical protein
MYGVQPGCNNLQRVGNGNADAFGAVVESHYSHWGKDRGYFYFVRCALFMIVIARHEATSTRQADHMHVANLYVRHAKFRGCFVVPPRNDVKGLFGI